MNRAEGITFLTRCADESGTHWSGGVRWAAEDCPTCHGTNDAGWLHAPCSRYGRTSADCAPIAWRHAYLIARESGGPMTEESLEHSMSLVVNDSDQVALDIREFGRRHYT